VAPGIRLTNGTAPAGSPVDGCLRRIGPRPSAFTDMKPPNGIRPASLSYRSILTARRAVAERNFHNSS
jgi:hypothetical protein